MPVCVHCNAPAPYVYTVYRSKDNVRLKVCDHCQQFADPLIEHPLVLLLIDLILLKPRVYRHLVFNRGSAPYRASRKPAVGKNDEAVAVEGRDRDVADQGEGDEEARVTKVNLDRRNIIWPHILLLAVITMSIETLVLYSTMSLPSNDDPAEYFSAQERRVWLLSAVIVIISTEAQHLTSTAISAAFLKIWYPSWLAPEEDKIKMLVSPTHFGPTDAGKTVNAEVSSAHPATLEDGRGAYFTLPMVSLTLFFSSLLPCILHVCLYIWSATAVRETGQPAPTRHSVLWNNASAAATSRLLQYVPSTWTEQWKETWHGIAGTLQKEGIDEMWVVVRLLAGMSSGFGLRVVLPGPPWMTSLAVLGGWLVKTGIQTGLHALVLV